MALQSGRELHGGSCSGGRWRHSRRLIDGAGYWGCRSIRAHAEHGMTAITPRTPSCVSLTRRESHTATLRGGRFRFECLVVYFPEKRPFRESSQCHVEENQRENGLSNKKTQASFSGKSTNPPLGHCLTTDSCTIQPTQQLPDHP